MTNTILKTKVTGNFKLVAVKRVFDDGRETFGFLVAKKGRGAYGFQGRFGYSECQAISLVINHDAATHCPDILNKN